jgi:subtilase family serine protease
VPRRSSLLGAIALLSVLCPLAGAGGARADVPAPRVAIQGPATLPASAAVTGDVSADRPVALTVALTPSDPAGLAAYAEAVSTPGSPVYHHDLTVAQFAQRFGATDEATDAVRDALAGPGLTVGSRAADGLSLPVAGTAAEAERAFSTGLARVTLAGGRSAYADTTAPTLPPAAAGAVQAVAGLDSLPVAAPAGLQAAAPDPRATASGAPSACPAAQRTGAHTAQTIAAAYGLDGLWAQGDVGAGTTVGLFELEPYAASDVAAYQSCYGISATVTDVDVDGGPGTGSGSGEAALDIEDVAGLAPGAQIKVFQAPQTGNGVLDAYAALVQDPGVQVISTSWGFCENGNPATFITAESALFQEAATAGKAVFAASGDSGTDDCGDGAATVDDPASQPFVTGVGGTSLGASAETVWSDGSGAAGGGVSQRWAQPAWQSSHAVAQSAIACSASPDSRPASTHTLTSCREAPDVSADADPQGSAGYAIYWGGNWWLFGGTSAAAPTWASVVALADASPYCAGRSPIGFVNPVLYGLPAADFNDVTSGDNGWGGVAGFAAGAGYDLATGLGSPRGALLVPALCGAASGTAVPAPPAATTTPTITTTTAPTTPPPTTTTTTKPVKVRPAPAVVQFVAPARRAARIGARVDQPLRADDRLGFALSYTATGLPAGLRIGRVTGIVSGTPRRTGTFTSTVLATDTAGNAQSVAIGWKIAGRAPRAAHQTHHPRARHHARRGRSRRVHRRPS